MENQVFKVEKVSGKGRKVKFTVTAGDDFSVPCQAVVSSLLIEFMSEAGDQRASDQEKMSASSAVWKRLLTEESYFKVLAWAEENLDSMSAEQEALGSLLAEVVEKVLPKAQK